MTNAEANPFTVQVNSAILTRAANLDEAILWTLGTFSIQQSSGRALGHSLASWAAIVKPRTIRHAGRTVARVTPRPDGTAGVERFDETEPRRATGRRRATQPTAIRTPAPSIIASPPAPAL